MCSCVIKEGSNWTIGVTKRRPREARGLCSYIEELTVAVGKGDPLFPMDAFCRNAGIFNFSDNWLQKSGRSMFEGYYFGANLIFKVPKGGRAKSGVCHIIDNR